MKNGETKDLVRPSVLSAAASPTSILSTSASLVLAVSFFLPHSVNADLPDRPAEMLMSFFSGENSVLLLMILWPFWFAMASLLLMVTLVYSRPKWLAKALFALPVTVATTLALLWCVLLFSRAEDSRSAMAVAAIVAPVGACVFARVTWLWRIGRITAAATWAQSLLCILAMFSLYWFWFPASTHLLWGGGLAIMAALVMMIASWTWESRARHDLYDRSVCPAAYQISLRQIAVAIALAAISLTYWKIISDWSANPPWHLQDR